MSEPIPYEPGEIDWEEVKFARQQPLEEKFLEGARLFDYASRIAMEGIRRQHPEATEQEVHEILRQRLELSRRLELDVDE